MQCLLAVFFHLVTAAGLPFLLPVPEPEATVTKTSMSKGSASEPSAKETEATDINADAASKEPKTRVKRGYKIGWYKCVIHHNKTRSESKITGLGSHLIKGYLRQVSLFTIKATAIVAVGTDAFSIQSLVDFECRFLFDNRTVLNCNGCINYSLGSAKRAGISPCKCGRGEQ